MTVYKGEPTKDGRCYYFRDYKKVNGELKDVKSKKYLTKKEAEQEERLFLMQKNNPYKKEFDLVALDYFKELKEIRKLSTYNSYERDYKLYILPYFGKKSINDIQVNDIKKWADELKKKELTTNYLNKVYNVLNNIFKYSIRNYGITSNPVKAYGRFQTKHDSIIKDESKIRYITLEEFNKFIEYVDNPIYNTFFYFAYYTGCRKGEIFALTWEDIDFDNKIIKINKTLYSKVKGNTGDKVLITNTKTGENRTITMNKTLYEKMKQYKISMEEYKDFNKKWYVFGNNQYLSSTTVDRIKDKAFELSGVHRITMHEFRHSHVSLLINEYIKQSKKNNMKVDTTKFFIMMSKRMGHSIEVMTKTYLHLFPNVQDEIVDLLDNL